MLVTSYKCLCVDMHTLTCIYIYMYFYIYMYRDGSVYGYRIHMILSVSITP